jgi:hypothetical protein
VNGIKDVTKSGTELLDAIQTRVKAVHTQSFDLSFNELLDMHSAGELNISPDYQRLFQWSEGARSRFVESLLLEMPVPPIFVIEEEEGKYLLIDGLQRISSYLHLRGELEAPHLDPRIARGDYLRLTDCDIVDELNGHTWETIGTALQIRLKRSFVRVEVVRQGSDARFKYFMFKRLNTGGQVLSDQQIRNCTIRLLDATFNDFLIQLSETESFRQCTAILSQSRRLSAEDQELVLRFFALRNYRQHFKHDVRDFLTEYMELVSDPERGGKAVFDYDKEAAAFEKTFAILSTTLGETSFAYVNPTTRKVVRGFSVSHFEAFTIGLQEHLPNLDPLDDRQMRALKGVLDAVKTDDKFIRIITGGGKNSPGPLQERIGFVSAALKTALYELS